MSNRLSRVSLASSRLHVHQASLWQCLRIRLESFGPDHPATARSHSALARAQMDQGADGETNPSHTIFADPEAHIVCEYQEDSVFALHLVDMIYARTFKLSGTLCNIFMSSSEGQEYSTSSITVPCYIDGSLPGRSRIRTTSPRRYGAFIWLDPPPRCHVNSLVASAQFEEDGFGGPGLLLDKALQRTSSGALSPSVRCDMPK
eukprot:2582475-Amphidinium_carterae.1